MFLFGKGVEVTVKQSKSDQAVIRSIISLKIERAFIGLKDEITLFEESNTNSRSYYFEMRSSMNPKFIGKSAVSSVEVNELLGHVKGLNLPRDPEREEWMDVEFCLLKIYDQQYQWEGPTPKGWEPLEKVANRLKELSEFERFSDECWKTLRIKWLDKINLKKHHPYSLQKGVVVYKKDMEPAGMYYRIGDAREFVKMNDIWLELEWESTNPYDQNAIKVMGCSRELSHGERKHIGYIPRKVAAILANYNLSNHMISCLHRSYYDFRTNTVIVNFDLAGPVTKWKEFKEALQSFEYRSFL